MVTIPAALRPRLEEATKTLKAKSVQALVDGLIDTGLQSYDVATACVSVGEKLAAVCAAHGYSSVEEVVEHLLRRGLKRLETTSPGAADYETRLRGLGYIE